MLALPLWRHDNLGGGTRRSRFCGTVMILEEGELTGSALSGAMMMEEELAGSASMEIDPLISSFFLSPLSSPLGSVGGFVVVVRLFVFCPGVLKCKTVK